MRRTRTLFIKASGFAGRGVEAEQLSGSFVSVKLPFCCFFESLFAMFAKVTRLSSLEVSRITASDFLMETASFFELVVKEALR